MELDRVPLWRGDHVAIRQLADDFARYVYLPRLRDSQVLTAAVQDGLGLLLWQRESFAYADGFDETENRYRGLRCGQRVDVFQDTGDGLLVKPDIALRQQQAETAPMPPTTGGDNTAPGPSGGSSAEPGASPGGASPSATANLRPKRYYGTVALDASRVGRDAGRIADEVIAHLTGLVGSEVTVTLEIEANIPSGVPDNVVRTVTENSRTLKFKNHGFENE